MLIWAQVDDFIPELSPALVPDTRMSLINTPERLEMIHLRILHAADSCSDFSRARASVMCFFMGITYGENKSHCCSTARCRRSSTTTKLQPWILWENAQLFREFRRF